MPSAYSAGEVMLVVIAKISSGSVFFSPITINQRPNTIVTASDTFQAAIGIADGVIVQIGRALPAQPSPTVQLKNHGVFTVDRSAKAAVKAAIMTEEVSRTVSYALQIQGSTGN
ncbi:MAG: class II aldolase/adducin family protein [Roseiflexaceae bacterium]